jgi:hypothetical protein
LPDEGVGDIDNGEGDSDESGWISSEIGDSGGRRDEDLFHSGL